MSRYYEMTATVRGYAPENIGLVKGALLDHWPFDKETFDEMVTDEGPELCVSGQSSLCGGESEDEFVDRLARAVWDAHGSYCYVEVQETCLDDLPSETHCREEDSYEEWQEAKKKTHMKSGKKQRRRHNDKS